VSSRGQLFLKVGQQGTLRPNFEHWQGSQHMGIAGDFQNQKELSGEFVGNLGERRKVEKQRAPGDVQ